MRDPKYFPEPEAFRPERHLRKVEEAKDHLQALNNLDLDDPASMVFGFGRRCIFCHEGISIEILIATL